MKLRKDSLGRRIPQYDRSAAAKKGALTRKEKDGEDIFVRLGSYGDHSRNRGYLGKLKDEGREEEIKIIATKGGTEHLNSKTPAERRAITKKITSTKRKNAKEKTGLK